MCNLKFLVISVVTLLVTSCVQLPDLNPLNANNDMSYVEVTPQAALTSLGASFDLIYNNEVQSTIEFLDIATERHIKITSAEHGNDQVLTDPIRIAQPLNKKKVKLLEPNQLTGAWVVGAEWQQTSAMLTARCHAMNPYVIQANLI